MNPYNQFVTDAARLVSAAKTFPLGGFPPVPLPAIAVDAPRALFFAPHPDDETIVGGLALRLLREAKMNVINVAVTQGSKKERQAERLVELQNACRYIGFGVETTSPNGLERVTAKTRGSDPQHWNGMVKVIADILIKHQPRVIFFPHERDWNGTHIGVHHLVMDAFHVGEVQRNPYHLSLPAWMMDNVRRGAELVGGQGEAAPDFRFAALYRLSKWSHGTLARNFPSGKFLSQSENPASLFT